MNVPHKQHQVSLILVKLDHILGRKYFFLPCDATVLKFSYKSALPADWPGEWWCLLCCQSSFGPPGRGGFFFSFLFFFFFLMSGARMGVRTRARWAGNRTRLSSLFKHNDRGEVIEKGVVRGRLPEKKKRWSASKRQETQTGCFCCTLRSYISWLAKSCVVCTCLMFGCVCNVVIWLVDHKASQPVWTEV